MWFCMALLGTASVFNIALCINCFSIFRFYRKYMEAVIEKEGGRNENL